LLALWPRLTLWPYIANRSGYSLRPRFSGLALDAWFTRLSFRTNWPRQALRPLLALRPRLWLNLLQCLQSGIQFLDSGSGFLEGGSALFRVIADNRRYNRSD